MLRRKLRAGILGATGTVGQRLVHLLADHPWFELTEVAASERSFGKKYCEAVNWHLDTPIPSAAANFMVKNLEPSLDCDFVFSALDSSVAGPAEEDFARAGYPVVSNSRNHRMDPDVPLLIPEVNAAHLDAISVAGYPGVSSMDIQGNVVPFISGEEEKMELEPQKLLGKWDGSRFVDAGIGLSAHCNRVPVVDGHLECVCVGLKKIASLDEVREALRNFEVGAELASLPTALKNPVVVRDEENRPQPRRDANVGNGMAAVVGRVRGCPLLDVKLTLLSHNLVRGAAGAALLNAELLAARGFLNRRAAVRDQHLAEPVTR